MNLPDAQDPFKCGALLCDGHWNGLQEGESNRLQNWQVPGCMLHNYRGEDISGCLRSKRVLFIGDSTTRRIFWATAKKLSVISAQVEQARAQNHSDAVFLQRGVCLEFVWDPYLNSTRLDAELRAFSRSMENSTVDAMSDTASASLILIGGGLWHASYIGVNYLKHFKTSINRVVQAMTSSLAPTLSYDGAKKFTRTVSSNDLLFLAPVQSPWYEKLSPARAATLTRDKVDSMNDYLQQLSTFEAVEIVWSFSSMLFGQKAAYREDGIHVNEKVAAKQADILLNLRCNAHSASRASRAYPYDGTCCSEYRRLGIFQWIVLSVGWTVLFSAYWIQCFLDPQRWGFRLPRSLDTVRLRSSQMLPSERTVGACIVFCLAIWYCYYADRSQVFNKLHKQFYMSEFAVLCCLAGILGLISIRVSKPIENDRNSNRVGASMSMDQPFLSREQTDEWKGWMQFIILIYHYTGASTEISIYRIVRLLVAAYLFMTGFGHTVYFLKKKDYSFRRVAAALVRLNLLSCALPYAMRTDYLFYYFAPLVSMWFLIVFATLAIGQSLNNKSSLLLGKIILSAVVVTTSTKLRGPFELLFLLLKWTCGIYWDVNEWRFRVSLDLFIVYIGMVCAVFFISWTTSKKPAATDNEDIQRVLQIWHLVRQGLVVLSSLLVILGYWAVTRQWTTKSAYNGWHPYISFLPILAFIILRNAHRQLRNVHSSVFAWLGRCSLETFTLQFHIWLAADTKGILSLGVFPEKGVGRWIEFTIMTAVFLWGSWCVAAATTVLTEWIITAGRVTAGANNTSQQPTRSPRRSSYQMDIIRQSMRHHESETQLEAISKSGVDPSWTDIDAQVRPISLVGRIYSNLNNTWGPVFDAVKVDLRYRVALLLTILWVANMVYKFYILNLKF